MSASPEQTIAALADLGTYPSWLSLVHGAEAIDDETWNVTLRYMEINREGPPNLKGLIGILLKDGSLQRSCFLDMPL